MTDTLTEPQFARVTGYDQAPACFEDGWLPDLDTFPELADARAEYFRLQAAWNAAGARRTLVAEKLENDQKRRELAMRDAYLRGENASLEPESDTLKAELAEAQQEAHAAAGAFVEHINRCVALVIDRREAWFATIDEYQHGIDEQVRKLAEQIAKLRTGRGNFARFEHWVERTGGRVRPPTADRPGTNQCGADEPHSHFPYAAIPLPASGNAAEEEARLTEWFVKSFAGWDGKGKPLTDEQGKALEQRNAEARARTPEEGVELFELDQDELVDWLMGTGRFDGHPKPGPDLVVAAAEGDPKMAERLLKAEDTATGGNPRQAVVDQLNQIVGGR